jgi:hypothetical protein
MTARYNRMHARYLSLTAAPPATEIAS